MLFRMRCSELLPLWAADHSCMRAQPRNALRRQHVRALHLVVLTHLCKLCVDLFNVKRNVVHLVLKFVAGRYTDTHTCASV